MFVPLRVPDLGSYSVCTSCLRAGKPRTNEDAEEIAGHLTNVTSPASPLPLISCIPSYSLQSTTNINISYTYSTPLAGHWN